MKFSWYSGPATMSAMKFPISSTVHVSLVCLRRSTCVLTFSMCAPEGRCRWHAIVIMLGVCDWMWLGSSCIQGLSRVIAAWQSDTILRSVFVCFWSAISRHSSSSSDEKADCALIELPPLMCIAIMGCRSQSGPCAVKISCRSHILLR